MDQNYLFLEAENLKLKSEIKDLEWRLQNSRKALVNLKRTIGNLMNSLAFLAEDAELSADYSNVPGNKDLGPTNFPPPNTTIAPDDIPRKPSGAAKRFSPAKEAAAATAALLANMTEDEINDLIEENRNDA